MKRADTRNLLRMSIRIFHIVGIGCWKVDTDHFRFGGDGEQDVYLAQFYVHDFG